MKLFVWDFHGTLEQGNELAVLEMSNIILEKHGYEERFSEAQCCKLYGKKWFEYFEYLLPNEPKNKHLKLQEDCFSFSDSHPEIIATHIKLVNHAMEVLDTIRRKHDQILISNTKATSLKIFLKSVGISHLFPEGKTFATDSHTKNGTKLDILKRFLTTRVFEEVVTIGDSPGDIEFGLAIGAKTFLYTHPGQEFKNCNPHFKINDLREILKII